MMLGDFDDAFSCQRFTRQKEIVHLAWFIAVVIPLGLAGLQR
jgi:hypothetical protein